MGYLKKQGKLIGKRIGIAGDQLTALKWLKALSKALGEEVTYNEITPEQYRGFGFPGADDLEICSSFIVTLMKYAIAFGM